MNERLTRFTLTLAMLLTLPGAGYAQSLHESLELNPFMGVSAYSHKDYQIGSPQSITPVSGRFRFNTAIRGGMRVNVYDRGHWGQDFLYSYEPNTAHFLRRSTPPGTLNLPLNVHNFAVNALYYFQEDETKRVRPFLTAGLGATLYLFTQEAKAIANDPLRGNVPDINASTEFAFNYGFGVKVRANNWVGFRLDARGFLSRTPTFGLAHQSTDPNATVFPATGPIQNGEVSAGLIFYFHKP